MRQSLCVVGEPRGRNRNRYSNRRYGEDYTMPRVGYALFSRDDINYVSPRGLLQRGRQSRRTSSNRERGCARRSHGHLFRVIMITFTVGLHARGKYATASTRANSLRRISGVVYRQEAKGLCLAGTTRRRDIRGIRTRHSRVLSSREGYGRRRRPMGT